MVIVALSITATISPDCVTARDPNYAVQVRVPDERASMWHDYRIVNLNWFNYLNLVEQRSEPLHVYYRVVSLPSRFKVNRMLSKSTSLSPLVSRGDTQQPLQAYESMVYDNNEARKKQYITGVFEAVFRRYLRLMNVTRSSVVFHPNTVDYVGIRLRMETAVAATTAATTPQPTQTSRIFNRTIIVSFEDPPYGQSRINRLVTNRNIPWTLWNGIRTDDMRFSSNYNVTEDIVYRYFHNIGHLLGFGHYLSSADHRTGKSTFSRSVMYPNIKDLRYVATIPSSETADIASFAVIRKDYTDLIDQNVQSFAIGDFATYFYNLIQMAARFA